MSFAKLSPTITIMYTALESGAWLEKKKERERERIKRKGSSESLHCDNISYLHSSMVS